MVNDQYDKKTTQKGLNPLRKYISFKQHSCIDILNIDHLQTKQQKNKLKFIGWQETDILNQ